MEYDRYIKHFEAFAGFGRVELHTAFEVPPSKGNPHYQEQVIKELEGKIRQYRERSYPGIQHRREGSKLWVDITAYRTEGHLDYFERAVRETNPVYGVKPIGNQLGLPINQK